MASHQAGGKPDGAQGVGTEVTKVQDALDAARKFFEAKTSSWSCVCCGIVVGSSKVADAPIVVIVACRIEAREPENLVNILLCGSSSFIPGDCPFLGLDLRCAVLDGKSDLLELIKGKSCANIQFHISKVFKGILLSLDFGEVRW